MTTPSIPDLIAALEEHDGAMTSGPWRHRQEMNGSEIVADCVLSAGDDEYIGVDEMLGGADYHEGDAAAIAWCGTHRGALAEALKAAMDALEILRAESHWQSQREARLNDERIATMHERDAAIAARDSACAVRDEATAEVRRIAAELAKVEYARDSAVAERDHLAKLVTCGDLARDSAVNDTAEAIAGWLEESTRGQQPQGGRNTVRIDVALKTAEAIRAGAWRGQNGGE